MSEVRVTTADGVARVTLVAPQRRNALTPAMATELLSVLDAIDDDRHIGAVVLAGEGGHFCAGADRATLDAVGEDPVAGRAYEDISTIYRSFQRFGELRVLTVAALRGALVGAGVNLALAADIRIASRTMRLISGFARIGLHPGGGHLFLLAAAGGPQVASASASPDRRWTESSLCSSASHGRRSTTNRSRTVPWPWRCRRARIPRLLARRCSRCDVPWGRRRSPGTQLSRWSEAPQLWSFRRRSEAGA